jgi:hypothetical protein
MDQTGIPLFGQIILPFFLFIASEACGKQRKLPWQGLRVRMYEETSLYRS